MPGRRRRAWVKLDTSILRSSINYEFTLEEQAVWMKSLALCGDLGHPPLLCDGDKRALPPQFIAEELHCPLEIWQRTLKKGIATQRYHLVRGIVAIVNWNNYQPEYDRQKPSREQRARDKAFTENMDYSVFYENSRNAFINTFKSRHGREPNEGEVREIEEQVRKRAINMGLKPEQDGQG